MLSRLSYRGFQPSSLFIFSLDATRVAGSPGRHFFGHVDNLFDAESVAVAEVVVGGFSAVFEIVESTDMSVGKVCDVNIVPHASAVGCGIIVAENADVISRAVCHLQNDGDKVGFGLVRLAALK